MLHPFQVECKWTEFFINIHEPRRICCVALLTTTILAIFAIGLRQDVRTKDICTTMADAHVYQCKQLGNLYHIPCRKTEHANYNYSDPICVECHRTYLDSIAPTARTHSRSLKLHLNKSNSHRPHITTPVCDVLGGCALINGCGFSIHIFML